MELISRDEALKRIEEAFDIGDCNCDRFALRGILKSLPTIEERKEGKWIFDEKGYFLCSECKEKPNNQYETTDYCPNCGARMKGE